MILIGLVLVHIRHLLVFISSLLFPYHGPIKHFLLSHSPSASLLVDSYYRNTGILIFDSSESSAN
jgi:hypothetical protein